MLEELKVPFEEVIIDLDTPRTPEYLKINPRGLVPALDFNGDIIIESAIVSNFLADQYPSHLLPPSNAPGGALQRARIALFVDSYVNKVQTPLFKLFTAETEEAREQIVDSAVEALLKEVEPLLADAKPFFGGSEKLTQAEVSCALVAGVTFVFVKCDIDGCFLVVQVLTGSFILRLESLTGTGDLFPKSLWTKIQERAPNFSKWAAAVNAHPSVRSIYNEKEIIDSTRSRIEKFRAMAKANA